MKVKGAIDRMAFKTERLGSYRAGFTRPEYVKFDQFHDKDEVGKAAPKLPKPR